MASDLSKDQFRGLLIPDPRLSTIWTGQSSFNQADPQPGIPAAQGNYNLSLTSSGAQSANTEFRVRTMGAGTPSKVGPGSFAWKHSADADTAYRGWDVPNVITGFESITWSDADSAIHPTVVTLDDQTVICAYHRKQNSGTENTICVRVMSPGSSSFGSEIELFAEVGALTAAIQFTFGQHLVKMANDRVLLYYFTHNGTVGNIRAYESTDKGATWSIAASTVLRNPISVTNAAASAAATTDKLSRIRAAYGGGQVLLMVGVKSDNTNLENRELWKQYASDSDGLFFEKVEDAPEVTSGLSTKNIFYELSKFDVLYQGGSFVVSSTQNPTGISQSTVSLARIGSAFQNLTSGSYVSTADLGIRFNQITSGVYFYEDELTMCTGGDGKIYIYAVGVVNNSSLARYGVCFMSKDDAESIEFLGDSNEIVGDDAGEINPGGVWWSYGNNSTAPKNYAVTFARGRVLLLANHRADPGNEDDSLSMIPIGGSSTTTMPSIDGYNDETKRGAWDYNWLPFDIPGGAASAGYWTKTTTGGTEALTSAKLVLTTGASQSLYYSSSPTTSVFTEGLIVRFSLSCTPADLTKRHIAVRIRLSTGGGSPIDDYDVTIAFYPGKFLVYDNNGSSQIGSDVALDMTTEREFIVAMKGGVSGSGAGDGKYQVWYRTKNSESDREWTKSIGSTTVHNNIITPAGTNLARWGHIISGAGVSRWSEFHLSKGHSAGENIVEQTNPTGLWAKPYAPIGYRAYLSGGTYITAHGGPARKNDLYFVDTRYGYPISRILFSESQTPRVAWRSTDLTQKTIALALDNTILGTDDSFPGNDVIGISLVGINWKTGELQGYNSGTASWATIAEIDSASGMSSLGWTREGGSVMPGGGSSGSQYLYTAEFAGGTFGLQDGTGTNLRKIVTNTGGKWSGSTVQKLPTVLLDGAAASDRSSGSLGYIMSPNVTVIAKLNGAKYAGYRLMIDAQSTVDGYFEIGTMVVGWVEAFGRQYSRGRIIETTANTSVVARTDGTTTSKNYGPSQRVVQFSWTDGVDVSSVQGSSPDPDYILGSSDGSAKPIASVGDVPYQIEGIVRMMNGPDKAVVYLPSVDKSGNTITLNRRHQFVAGRLTSPARLESVVGDENADPGEVFRVATVSIEEIV